MKADRLSISVVMCAYTCERWTDLVRAIASVQRQTIPADEIILTVDHNPELLERARKAFRDIIIIENNQERGLSGARNSGLAVAHGQIVAFIDEDAVASSSWIESLLWGYNSENIVGVGGTVRPLWEVQSPGWFPEEFNWVVGCSYKGLPEGEAPIRNPIGCNMSFRKQELESVGGFRNNIGRIGRIPLGCEETELSIRMRQSMPMAVILFEPLAIVYHKVPDWRATWSYFAQRCYSEGLSKALVTKFVGGNDGLSSERSYTAVTLPRGIINGLKETFVQKRLDGIKRAATIVAGLGLTTAGFMLGSIRLIYARGERNTSTPKVVPETSGQTYS